MAEDFVSYDKYRADLADFRSDFSRFREEIRVDLTNFRTEVKTDISNLRTELKTEMLSLHNKTIIWLVGIIASAVALLKLLP